MISKQSAVTIRSQLKLTQEELAELIKGHQVTVSRYETGTVPCNYSYLKRIAEATGYDITIRVSADGESQAWISGL